MGFDINEQMNEDAKNFGTQNQRNVIYNDYLVPLKAKISQILLYDVNVANTLLQKYISIEKNDNRSIADIMKDISELELSIQEYEENRGKEQLFKDQSEVISMQLEELTKNCEELDIKDFETRFSEIREIFNKNLNNYSYEDRSSIEAKIAEAQGKLIIKKVRLGALDLHDDILKDDEARLTMTINNAIYNLMQNSNPNVQKIVNEIKYKIIDRTDAVYDPEIWRLLDTAQRDIENNAPKRTEKNTTNVNTLNALVPITSKKRKGFTLPSLGEIFGRDVIKIGDQRMKIANTVQMGDMTIKPRDLAEIDLEWLAEQVPQQMLADMEEKRLIQEGKRKLKQKYIPDRKTPIYDAFETIENEEYKYEYTFYNESGTKLRFVGYDKSGEGKLVGEDGSYILGRFDRFDPICKNKKIINYAVLIDKLTNNNLKQQLLNELGVCVEKQILRNDISSDSYTSFGEEKKIISKLPILRNLSESYNKVMKEIKETKMDFRAQEKAKRDEFYQKNQFKEDLKPETSSNNQVKGKTQQSEIVRHNEAHDGQAEL